MASRAGLTRTPRSKPAPAQALLYPLDALYAHAGVAPPLATRVAPARLPQPYRSLLHHERDMTLTLEAHCGDRVALRVLATRLKGRTYLRRILLVEASTGRPVEMGAVRLNLSALSPRARTAILQNRAPLSRVLRDQGVDFLSRPAAFLAVRPNADLMGVFWMPGPRTLYGRRTEVFADGRRIGDIVEILPPL